MLDFLASISSAITTIITFLMNSVTNLYMVIQMIPSGVAFLQACLAFLPAPVLVFAYLGVTISVMFLIIDR